MNKLLIFPVLALLTCAAWWALSPTRPALPTQGQPGYFEVIEGGPWVYDEGLARFTDSGNRRWLVCLNGKRVELLPQCRLLDGVVPRYWTSDGITERTYRCDTCEEVQP